MPDAQIGGSLRLSGRPGCTAADGPALIADRIVVGGTFYARRLRSDGELRLPGGRIAGNLDLAGAELASPTGDALDAAGVVIGGSLHAGRHLEEPELAFATSGRMLLAGARVEGDLVFSGARIDRAADRGAVAEPPGPRILAESRMPPVPGRHHRRRHLRGRRPHPDRGQPGTGRRPAASTAPSGCPTRSSVATCGCPGPGCPSARTVVSDRGIALLADGMEVGGDLEGRDHGRGALPCAGQLRLVGAQVRGSASLSGIELTAPDGYALLADRLRIGGEFYLRRIHCQGTIRLQDAEVGATLDCTGAQLDRPRRRADGIGAPVARRPGRHHRQGPALHRRVPAAGGVRLRRTEARKSAQFIDAILVGPPDSGFARFALNAYGLTTAELILP